MNDNIVDMTNKNQSETKTKNDNTTTTLKNFTPANSKTAKHEDQFESKLQDKISPSDQSFVKPGRIIDRYQGRTPV